MSSEQTIQETLKVVSVVHSKRGFKLRNFLFNSGEALQAQGIGEVSEDSTKKLASKKVENAVSPAKTGLLHIKSLL